MYNLICWCTSFSFCDQVPRQILVSDYCSAGDTMLWPWKTKRLAWHTPSSVLYCTVQGARLLHLHEKAVRAISPEIWAGTAWAQPGPDLLKWATARHV
jgi:hypothetical protein